MGFVLVLLVPVLVLANVNIEVGSRSDEVDVVLNRNGNGVRVASNVMRASGAVLVDFVDGIDCWGNKSWESAKGYISHSRSSRR